MSLAKRLRNGFRQRPRRNDLESAAASKRLDGPPRLISLSMVKNEQDIIEPFVRHNARFVDCMVIIDNASVDDTRAILINCARELGRIIVSDSASFAYTQAEQMTRLLQYCQAAFFADFVMFLDADEFISARDAADLREKLAAIPAGGVGLMPWQTFLAPAPSETGVPDDPPRTMRFRRREEVPLFRKAVLRLDKLCRDDLAIWQGNHDIVTGAGERLPSADLDRLPLLHFPVRSREQLYAKSVVGWMAYLARNPSARHANEGLQWRDCFDRFVNHPVPPSDADLLEMSMRYAQDSRPADLQRESLEGSPPGDYSRQYSTGEPADPLELIARSWERSLSQPQSLLAFTRPQSAPGSATASTTSFDGAWHWDNLFVDVPPFRFMGEKYRPRHVLDIGCGIGAYLKLFETLGAETVVGVDGIPADATILAGCEYVFHDLSRPLQLNRSFDLVVCVEVAEHIDGKLSETLLDNITRHATGCILFSAAEPRQPGHGHINCQPIEHWLECFAARGWYPDLMDSLGIRAIATLSWLRRNLVVLRRGDPAAGRTSIKALAAIGALPFAWYGQEPGTREQPFSEPFPSGLAGYETVQPSR